MTEYNVYGNESTSHVIEIKNSTRIIRVTSRSISDVVLRLMTVFPPPHVGGDDVDDVTFVYVTCSELRRRICMTILRFRNSTSRNGSTEYMAQRK